ncbi:MAG: acyl-CoA dehydrogenase family protein, partial [Gammaproteobacteria bacterium]
PAAELLLVSARESDGRIGLFVVPAGSPRLRMEPYRTIDGSPAAELAFTDLRLDGDARLGEGDALPAIRTLLDLAALLVSAEAIGAMDALLERTVAYAKTRKQFGVPIGSFQALQHRMADMFIELEQSRSILLMALLAADGGAEDPARAISAAKHRIGRAARRIGQEAKQLHGGIGVTDALDVGHYVKRLTASSEAPIGRPSESVAPISRITGRGKRFHKP